MTDDRNAAAGDQDKTIAVLKEIRLWLQICAGLLVLLILQVTIS